MCVITEIQKEPQIDESAMPRTCLPILDVMGVNIDVQIVVDKPPTPHNPRYISVNQNPQLPFSHLRCLCIHLLTNWESYILVCLIQYPICLLYKFITCLLCVCFCLILCPFQAQCKKLYVTLVWKSTMDEEMVAIHLNSNWNLVSLPTGKSLVRCR